MTARGPLVTWELDEQVATVTLDSDHNRNALGHALITELLAVLDAIEADPAAHVVVLRSNGRAFSSGLDLSEALDTGMAEAATLLMALLRRMLTLRTPIVAVLRGPVRAGALGVVGAADLVVAASSVSFQLSEVRLAVAPAVISPVLQARVPARVLAELCLTARRFEADEAASMGLVTHSVDDAEVEAEVQRVVASLLLGEPEGARATKRLLNRELVRTIDREGAALAAESASLFAQARALELAERLLGRQRT